MSLTVVTSLFDFAKKIFDFNGELKKAKAEKKEKIADFLNKVANALEELIKNVRDNESSAESCSELSIYMESLMELLEPYLPQEKIDEFSSSLRKAALIRNLRAELSSDDKEVKLDQIAETIGKLRGVANVITL